MKKLKDMGKWFTTNYKIVKAFWYNIDKYID